MKIRSRTLVPALLITLSSAVHGQLNALYGFAASSSAYTPITGGTVLVSTSFDDAVMAIDVPSFFFNGSYYTTAAVSSNGFLSFGTDPLITLYTPISSSTAGYAGAISVFGANLKSATTGSPEIRYQQVGNEFVVQWQDMARSTGGVERFSFQARLQLTTGAVKFSYSAVTSLGSATTQFPEVGLRGPTATTTNVKNRKVGTGTGASDTWANPPGGTAVTDKMRFTSTPVVKSPAGTELYTFTPGCLSPVATTSISSDCLTNSFKVTVNISSLGTATAANIVASPGGTLFSAVGTGNYICGPFTLGTPVTLSVVHTTNAGCTNALGVFNPATNCGTIVNGDCIPDPFLTIPDNGCGSGADLQAIIPISGYNTTLGSAPGQTSLVAVMFTIAHTYRGDLQVRLTSPSGQTRDMLLQEPSPNSSASNFGNPGACPGGPLQMRDAAADPVSAIDPDLNNVIGSYRPEQPLSGFTGNANGNWVMRICDASTEDIGTLQFANLFLRNVDCAGVPGGTTLPGSACNDNDPNTTGDVYGTNCVCAGQAAAGVSIAARVLLDGPYDAGTSLMHDSLRTRSLLPLIEPYTGLGFPITGGGGETTTNTVLTTTGNNAIVDWVLLELRNATTPTTIVRSQCALVQRDGDVVAPDGVSPVLMRGAANGSYYIAVRHRNHLGAMTAAAIPLSSTATNVDFSAPATATFGTQAQTVNGSKNLLWGGNVVLDNKLAYTGTNNDRDPILLRIGSTAPNNIVSGYFQEDVGMDGYVKYTGSGNDRDPILLNVGSTIPNNTRTEQLP